MITFAWLFRYDIEISSDSTGYRLDRWTGNVDWILANEIRRVRNGLSIHFLHKNSNVNVSQLHFLLGLLTILS